MLRQWILLLAPSTAIAAPVSFHVQVPRCTPKGDVVMLRSNRIDAAVYQHDPLVQVGPDTWSGTFDVATDPSAFNYKYTHTICDEESCVGVEKSLMFVGDDFGEVADRTLAPGTTSADDYVYIWRDALTDFDPAGQPIGVRPDDERVAFCGPYLSITGPTAVTVGYDAFGGGDVALEWGPTTAYGDMLTHTAQHRNFFELGGLTPGATYHYRVIEDGTPGPDQTFRAPVAPGTPFRFAMFGDTQFYDTPQRLDHMRFAERVRAFAPDLVLSVGDMVASEPGANGPNGWMYPEMARWSLFYGVMADLLARAPFMVAMGNHEEDAPYFWDVFQFPEPDAPAIDHYDFRYGSVHFTVLYTGTTDGYDRDAILDSQTPWLERTLTAADADPDIRWKVVFLHRGPYHQGANHPTDGLDFYDAATPTRPSWQALMMQHHVDVVLAGHNHNFTYAQVDGIRFLTACSGAPLHDLRTPTESYTLHAERACTANLFTAGARTLSFEAHRLDDTIIDEARFSLCKAAPDCEELSSGCPLGARWSCILGACTAECLGSPDAGQLDALPSDAGEPEDAGELEDAPATLDAAGPDATARPDGAVGKDAGFFGLERKKGCGCTASEAPPRGGGVLVLALLLWAQLVTRCRPPERGEGRRRPCIRTRLRGLRLTGRSCRSDRH